MWGRIKVPLGGTAIGWNGRGGGVMLRNGSNRNIRNFFDTPTPFPLTNCFYCYRHSVIWKQRPRANVLRLRIIFVERRRFVFRLTAAATPQKTALMETTNAIAPVQLPPPPPPFLPSPSASPPRCRVVSKVGWFYIIYPPPSPWIIFRRALPGL